MIALSSDGAKCREGTFYLGREKEGKKGREIKKRNTEGRKSERSEERLSERGEGRDRGGKIG